MNALLFVLVAPLLAQSPAGVAASTAAPTAAPAAAPAAPAAVKKPVLLFPPKAPVRSKNSLDSAGEVARDLAAAVEYFEAGQSYYRAFSKGSHTPEENAAFVAFLEEYDKEQLLAKRTYAALGQWLDKKSGVKD